MLSRAHSLIENYKENGISSDRILIRLPATWQGIQAAKQLEQEGIAAHVTLIYRYCILLHALIILFCVIAIDCRCRPVHASNVFYL